MAMDRQGTGLVIIRVCLGVFLIAQAVAKLRWMADPELLNSQLSIWLMNAAPGSISQHYLQRIAIPYAWIFARLVPAGELMCGLALVAGFFTSLSAFIAFVMVLNYQIASGAMFEMSFIASRSAFPVLASTLGLAVGGVRLPWSVR